MPSQEERDKYRRERIAQSIISNPQQWKDIQDELRVCLSNTLEKLISHNTEDRDFYAGKYCGIAECLDIDDTEEIRNEINALRKQSRTGAEI